MHGAVLLLVKLQAEACNVTKSNTPPWVFFTFLKLYKWYHIAQKHHMSTYQDGRNRPRKKSFGYVGSYYLHKFYVCSILTYVSCMYHKRKKFFNSCFLGACFYSYFNSFLQDPPQCLKSSLQGAQWQVPLLYGKKENQPKMATCCHTLPLVIPLVVIRFHSLSLDILLVCLFINDHFNSRKTQSLEFIYTQFLQYHKYYIVLLIVVTK